MNPVKMDLSFFSASTITNLKDLSLIKDKKKSSKDFDSVWKTSIL